MTGDYLTTEEVCKKTKTSRRTIYRRLKSGELRGKKFGSVWRFRPEEVERLAREP